MRDTTRLSLRTVLGSILAYAIVSGLWHWRDFVHKDSWTRLVNVVGLLTGGIGTVLVYEVFQRVLTSRWARLATIVACAFTLLLLTMAFIAMSGDAYTGEPWAILIVVTLFVIVATLLVAQFRRRNIRQG